MGEPKEIMIARFVNLLERTGDMAREAALTGSSPGSRPYLIGQYNRVHAKLTSMNGDLASLFTSLDDDTEIDVVAMASHQLAAFLLPGTRQARDGRLYESVLDLGPFKIVMSHDFKDVGEMSRVIREAVRRAEE